MVCSELKVHCTPAFSYNELKYYPVSCIVMRPICSLPVFGGGIPMVAMVSLLAQAMYILTPFFIKFVCSPLIICFL